MLRRFGLITRALATIAVVGLALVLIARTPAFAESEPPPVALTWNAPSECPDAAYVTHEIARLLEGGAADRTVDVRADVTHARSGAYEVKLATNDRGVAGARTLAAPSCAAIADAVVLIVAMSIDPARVAAKQSQSESDGGMPDASPPSIDASTSSTDAATSVTVTSPLPEIAGPSALLVDRSKPAEPAFHFDPPPADSSHFAVSAFFAGDLGSLPTVAVGPEIAIAYRLAPFRFELSSAFFPHSQAAFAGSASGGGTFELSANDLVGCYIARVSRVDFGPCVGGELAWMRGSGFDVRNSTPSTAIWGGGVAQAKAWVRIGARFALRLDLGAVAPFERPRFEIDGVGVVHRPSAVAGRLGIGGEIHF